MAYLEQSTRYVPLTARPRGKWQYVVPAEVDDPALRSRFVETLDRAFATYARWIEPLQAYYRKRHPREDGDSEGVHRSVIRAKALDALRGLLPAATRSNVGIYGSGQAYEALLLRMQAHELAESRELAGLMLAELRKVIPAFLERVDREDRGGRWARLPPSPQRRLPPPGRGRGARRRRRRRRRLVRLPGRRSADRVRSGGRDQGGGRRALPGVGGCPTVNSLTTRVR